MLQITVPSVELWDSRRQEFVNTNETTLQLEHSLLSVSKWESRWNKPFLSSTDKSSEEVVDYIKCMTINRNVDPNVYLCLSDKNILAINKYIESPMTATTFSDNGKKAGRREIITSEIIYHWMITYGIPFECEKWHLNRLLTLVRVCSVKNSPPKKMSSAEIVRRNEALNAARRKKLHSKG